MTLTATDNASGIVLGPTLTPRRLVLPAVMTLAMLAVLIGLGWWQMQRLAWKTALLASIDHAEQLPGVPLGPAPAAFTKVRVTGILRHDVGRYGADVRETPAGEVIGAQLVTVLDRDAGPPVLVLAGWVPTGDAHYSLPAGRASFDGYIRAPDRPGLFSARDDPSARLFYTLDPASIGPALGAPNAAPFVLVLLGQARPGVYPQPAERLPRPPNDHLGYALTWFGLAATLAVVFTLYVRKVLRP